MIIPLKKNINKLAAKKYSVSLKDINQNSALKTPFIVKYYKIDYKNLLPIYRKREKVIKMLYEITMAKYCEEENIDFTMEKIYIKTKLGSYLSGGCGIGPSLLASLIGSGLFTYMSTFIQRLNGMLTFGYFSIVTGFAIYLLTLQDNQVEMYNMLLEIIENIEKEYTYIKY